jgi:hypothetical protein
MFRPIKLSSGEVVAKVRKKSCACWLSCGPKYVANFCKNRIDFITKVLVFNWIVVRLFEVRKNNGMSSQTIVIKLNRGLFSDTKLLRLYSVKCRWINEHGVPVESYWQIIPEILGENKSLIPTLPKTSPTKKVWYWSWVSAVIGQELTILTMVQAN